MAYRVRSLSERSDAVVSLSLTHQEVEERLASRSLRSTDLVMIAGTWTTIGESIAFCDFAEPFARRERLIRTSQGALSVFVSIGLVTLLILLRVIFGH